jgi:putative copper export protein
MADPIIIVLLVLHIGAIAAWMGGAALFVSVIIPSLSKMSPTSRSEFIQSALPRYLRFISGSSILAIMAGLILYYYTIPATTSPAQNSPGPIYIQAGAVLGLVVLMIAFGILVPSGRKLISLVKQTPQTESSAKDATALQIASLQKRMGMAGRLGVTLLGIALILMIIGASI